MAGGCDSSSGCGQQSSGTGWPVSRDMRNWPKAHADGRLEENGTMPNIPPKANRRWKTCFSPVLYRDRNAIERMFCRLKDFRRVATRYDRNAVNFLAAVCIAATVSYWVLVPTLSQLVASSMASWCFMRFPGGLHNALRSGPQAPQISCVGPTSASAPRAKIADSLLTVPYRAFRHAFGLVRFWREIPFLTLWSRPPPQQPPAPVSAPSRAAAPAPRQTPHTAPQPWLARPVPPAPATPV